MAQRRRGRGRGPAPQPVLDLDRPAGEQLSPAEVAEMQQHLGFLRRYRRALRLKLNAAESLMVDGTHAPDHRGRCKHLLGKVDRAAIAGAMQREPLARDPSARPEFLAGAAALTRDLGVLLDSLEAQTALQSRLATRRALNRAISRMDFASASAPRLQRLIALLRQAYPAEQRVHALLQLLHNDSFRAACDRHVGKLEVAELYPLRAVHAALHGASPERVVLSSGLRMLLEGDADALGAQRRSVRERLALLGLEVGVEWAIDAQGVMAVIEDSRSDAGLVSQLQHLRGEALLAVRRYDEARAALVAVGDVDLAPLCRWLGMPRVGPIAVSSRDVGPLTRGFDLDRRTLVAVHILPADLVEAAAAQLASATLPGVLSPCSSGVDGGLGWVAVDARAPLFGEALAVDRMMPVQEALALASAGCRLLHALSLAQRVPADIDPSRFLLDRQTRPPRLLLADLSGPLGGDALAHARQWCRWTLAWPPFGGLDLRPELPPAVSTAVEEAVRLPALVRSLDMAATG